MNTKTETKPVITFSEAATKIENPMQERHCGQVIESVQVTAEAALAARRLDAPGESGPVFVP